MSSLRITISGKGEKGSIPACLLVGVRPRLLDAVNAEIDDNNLRFVCQPTSSALHDNRDCGSLPLNRYKILETESC